MPDDYQRSKKDIRKSNSVKRKVDHKQDSVFATMTHAKPITGYTDHCDQSIIK